MSIQQSLFPTSLADVLAREEKLKIEKAMAIERAMKGDDVDEFYQAREYLKNIEKREVVNSKSLLVDPMELTSSFGYKDKPYTLSYDVLRAMSRTHIIKAIIETRKEQVLNYCEPQKDKYSTGFIIQRKEKFSQEKKEAKLSKADEKKINGIIEFLLACGTASNFWHADTFDGFISKLIDDALSLDQATFEVVRNRKFEPVQFFATDGASYRIADTYNDDENNTRHPDKIVQGYLPSYVQLYQSKVVAEFYPWELCFGIRNPKTDIRMNGYGKAELEDMIGTVTAILNADTYNANFFKVGSAPKGILKYSGNVNQNTLEDFRRQWLAQVAGAMNAHKIPMINADKLDFISTNIPNKDMEYNLYYEFLIKIACAIFKIDPSEVGFPMSGNSAGTNGLGGDNQEEKVKYSKDKGLKPLLKKLQYWINKYLIWQIDPEFEFRFVGIDVDSDEQTELDRDCTKLQNFMTFNEIREKYNLEPLPNGDVPANPVYLQTMQMQQQQQQNDQQQQQYEDDQDPFGSDQGDQGGDNENPFTKSLHNEIESLLTTEL